MLETNNGLPTPILFPEFIQHREIYNELKGVQDNLLSAGFCNGKGDVWGTSVSLGKSCREEDSIYIKKMLTGE